MYALYCTEALSLTSCADQNRFILQYALLAISPMCSATNEDYEAPVDATSFNAKVHLKFIKTVFFYKLSVKDLCLCLIGDNAITNLRVAKPSALPHVGCSSDKLNLELNAIFDSHFDLKSTMDLVGETIVSARPNLKTAVVIRNITDLRPKVDKPTRW